MDDRVKSAWIHRSVRCSKRFFCHVFRRWQGTVLDRNRIFLNQAKRITLERGLQKRLHDGRAGLGWVDVDGRFTLIAASIKSRVPVAQSPASSVM